MHGCADKPQPPAAMDDAARMDPRIALGELGGIARVAELRARGVTRDSVERARSGGRYLTPRRGWLALPDAPPSLIRAVRLGTRLGCVSAAEHLGFWTPASDALHLAAPKHAGRVTIHEAGTVVHWRSARWCDNPDPVESVPDLLRQVAVCLEREDAIAVAESALHAKAVDHRTLLASLGRLPAAHAAVGRLARDGSGSGTETLCRVRLEALGLPLLAQVHIENVGHVDLLVGRRLVIECDSRAWHGDPSAIERDRARDLELTRLGYRVIRVSWLQVTHGWREVEAAVLAAVARGEHR
jgi:very-short-patch-repair endonuclease